MSIAISVEIYIMEGTGMNTRGGSFLNVYYPDTRVSFWSNKDEAVTRKANTYGLISKEICDSPIT